MKILMVLTSHDKLGDTGNKTGFWLEEFVAPYYVFLDGGAQVTLASPKGGQPPVDPKSHDPGDESDTVIRFNKDEGAQAALAHTVALSSIEVDDFDAIFFPGGHGPMWDLAEDPDLKTLLESACAAGKPVAAVCHGPAVFRHVKGPDGRALVDGKRVTGFSNSEEEAVGLTDIVPFLLEDMLKENGGQYSKGEDWSSYALTDGKLVTGQNPASSAETAKALLALLH